MSTNDGNNLARVHGRSLVDRTSARTGQKSIEDIASDRVMVSSWGSSYPEISRKSQQPSFGTASSIKEGLSSPTRPTYGKELCLLSLDGGGVRGLSSLQILKRLMESINPENPPKPCDYFDMIGGTSTGGLIALMLGRLCMPVNEAIEAYIALAPKIFTKIHHRVTLKGQIQGRFDHTAIEDGVRNLLDEKGYPRETLLKHHPDGGCKTFVCATNKLTTETTILSSYPSRRRGTELLNITKVWQAARATAAASSFFDPINIGGVEFVDGATPANNPIGELWTEAFDTFKEGDDWRLEDNIRCLVSIGTGIPAIKPFGDGAIELGKALLAIATDTEKRAEEFHRHHSHMARQHRYFRFNVLRGLENVGLEHVSKRDQIMASTQAYLQSETVFSSIEACGLMLIERENLQPVIEAARYTRDHSMVDLKALGELDEVQEALKPGSASLSWFTNTSKFRKWWQEEDKCECIWYPITTETALHKHENIIPTLYYHILQQPGANEPQTLVFYIRFPENQIYSRPARLEDIFTSLISQVLVTYSDVCRTLLSLPRGDREGLKKLFEGSSNISEEDILDLFLACLRMIDAEHGLPTSSSKKKIIILENARSTVQIAACKLAFRVARLAQSTRLLMSSNNGQFGVREAESWHDQRIDERTEYSECLASLKFENMFSRRDQIVHAESGTNEWIWSCEPYIRWINTPSGILWIQGKPGSGKSVIAKSILSRLLNTSSTTQPWIIANWFYNGRGGEISTSHLSMLRAILFQILDQDRSLFRFFQEAYRSSQWNQLHANVLLQLSRAGPGIRPIICIIDAMDESKDESAIHLSNSPTNLEDTLDLLQEIAGVPESHIKILVLSRPNRCIEKCLRHSHKVVLEYANSNDIEILVDSGLRSIRKKLAVFDSSDEEEPKSKRPRWTKSPSSQLSLSKASSSSHKTSSSRIFNKSRESEDEEFSSIREYMLKNARGVILWVTLILKDLLRHVEKGMFTFWELRKLLGELPLELHGLYCRIVHDLQSSNNELDQVKARRILVWVVGASETKLLEIRELLDALAITWKPEDALKSSSDPIPPNRPQVRSWNHFRRSIQELCGPFIEVIRPASKLSGETFDDFEVEPTFLVQLAHQTAKDFLACSDAQSFQVDIFEAKRKVALDKIDYLTVALPPISTFYIPASEISNTGLPTNVDNLVKYFEQKLLLCYIFATLPLEVSRNQLGIQIDFWHPPPLMMSPLLWPFLFKDSYPDISVMQATKGSIIGAYFFFAFKFGFVTAVKNMLAIAGLTKWWWSYYNRTVENAALLAAIENGLFAETKHLLRSHPSGSIFLSANKELLQYVAQTGNEEIAMYVYDKCAAQDFRGFSDRQGFLDLVRKSSRSSTAVEVDVAEVQAAIWQITGSIAD